MKLIRRHRITVGFALFAGLSARAVGIAEARFAPGQALRDLRPRD